MTYLIVSTTIIVAVVLYGIITTAWILAGVFEKPMPKVKNDLPELLEKYDNELKRLHL